MEETGLITIDSAAREADSDRRRIEATLSRFPTGSPARNLLEQYHATLCRRVETGILSLRSMRLALTPAAGLLEVAAQRLCMPPDQGALDAFLRETPGHAAAVNGFVSHVRQTRDAELTMPSPRARARAQERRARLRPNMLALMQQAGNAPGTERQWAQLALQYFHDLPSRMANNIAEGGSSTGGRRSERDAPRTEVLDSLTVSRSPVVNHRLRQPCHNGLLRSPVTESDPIARADRRQPAPGETPVAKRPRIGTENPMTHPMLLLSTRLRWRRPATASAPRRITTSRSTAPSMLFPRSRPINDPTTFLRRNPGPTHRTGARSPTQRTS